MLSSKRPLSGNSSSPPRKYRKTQPGSSKPGKTNRPRSSGSSNSVVVTINPKSKTPGRSGRVKSARVRQQESQRKGAQLVKRLLPHEEVERLLETLELDKIFQLAYLYLDWVHPNSGGSNLSYLKLQQNQKDFIIAITAKFISTWITSRLHSKLMSKKRSSMTQRRGSTSRKRSSSVAQRGASTSKSRSRRKHEMTFKDLEKNIDKYLSAEQNQILIKEAANKARANRAARRAALIEGNEILNTIEKTFDELYKNKKIESTIL